MNCLLICFIYIIEVAWDIITDFATELIEGPDKERVCLHKTYDFPKINKKQEEVVLSWNN